ncbi:hypothetical protein FIBSPDRAFT_863884 [Athelia psychrophila]|uniref:Uncharacterized protein n=1 Tax=Athelia psychrophila TaxID=1759441 RepID=A0A166BUR5_9AGAM|nr:hypothetical protein FIBSPDRAFT_869746 [Fibularhizoctonia sp. CBS 109695]KZP18396.1 hypothetical protein FIBSPDRAFT_863884 [Fibularhizoctonia sp. CBS 109695]
MRSFESIYENPFDDLPTKEATASQLAVYKLGGCISVIAIASFSVWYFMLWTKVPTNLWK